MEVQAGASRTGPVEGESCIAKEAAAAAADLGIRSLAAEGDIGRCWDLGLGSQNFGKDYPDT